MSLICYFNGKSDYRVARWRECEAVGKQGPGMAHLIPRPRGSMIGQGCSKLMIYLSLRDGSKRNLLCNLDLKGPVCHDNTDSIETAHW